MAQLIISRDSGYADRLRTYAILLDGKKIGNIGNGETQTFSIAQGKHVISAKIDWCGSSTLDFTATEGASPSFRVGSNMRGIRILFSLWYVLIERNKYLRIEQTSNL